MNEVVQELAIHARIGRNLLVFQQLEAMLKRVVPFLVREGISKDVPTIRTLRAKIKKAPFGTVMDLLVDSSEILSPRFRDEIRAITKSRNDLVHRLIMLPEAGLLNGDRQTAIRYLDGQYAAAMRFREVVFPMYESVVDALGKGEAVRIVHCVVDEE